MAKGFKSGGRQLGTKNKSTRSLKEALLALRFDVAEEFVKLYRDPDLSPQARLRILVEVLPYVAPRLRETEVDIDTVDVTPVASDQSTDALLAIVSPASEPK